MKVHHVEQLPLMQRGCWESLRELRRRPDQRGLGVDRRALHLLRTRLGVAGSFRGGLEVGGGQLHLKI